MDLTNLMIEAIEVYINHILYVRDIYPPQIFKKRRIYNTPIYISIYPPLNAYLYKVLRSTRELLQRKELLEVELLFYRNEMITYERYKFKLANIDINVNNQDDDKFLLSFEEELRSSLYLLAERVKALERLPSNTKFKLLLKTTQAGFVRLSNNPNYQDFPWLHESTVNELDKRQIEILPLTHLESVGLQVIAEVL